MARKSVLANTDPTVSPVRYMKVPPFVEAYEITEDNVASVGRWAQATVTRDETGKPVLILRKLSPPYNKGRIGDFVVKSDSGDLRIANKFQFLDVYVIAPKE